MDKSAVAFLATCAAAQRFVAAVNAVPHEVWSDPGAYRKLVEPAVAAAVELDAAVRGLVDESAAVSNAVAEAGAAEDDGLLQLRGTDPSAEATERRDR